LFFCSSTKYNLFDFEAVLKYFKGESFVSFGQMGGVAHIPIWRLRGNTADEVHFESAVYHTYGTFPPNIRITDERFVLCRLLRILDMTYRDNEVSVAIVLIRNDIILGLRSREIFLTPEFRLKACLALVPVSMLWYPLVPISVRQSYKKNGASNNIIVQSRPTLFRDNDGLISDGNIYRIKRAWQGEYSRTGDERPCRVQEKRYSRRVRSRSPTPARSRDDATCPTCSLFLCNCDAD